MARGVARVLVGRDPSRRAAADFILLTLARNRTPQTSVAANLAIGFAIVVAALSRGGPDLASLASVRTAVLWMPLALAYWLAIGMRASFFVPSELPAAWAFESHGADDAAWMRRAIPAAMIGFVLPPTVVASMALTLLVGWQVAAWNLSISAIGAILIIEVLALTIVGLPFTRAYRPGHAKLRSRWPLYLIGMWIFAYWPAHIQVLFARDTTALVWLAGIMGGLTVAAAASGRFIQWSAPPSDDAFLGEGATAVLDIGLVSSAPAAAPPH
jgi:hypothetical protein